MRWLTLGLLALLALVQADLWLGRSSVPRVLGLQAQLDAQQAENDAVRERNTRLAAEVGDLKEGLEMVEEKARAELGMVKPDEILVQLSAPAPAAAATATATPAPLSPPAPPAPLARR